MSTHPIPEEEADDDLVTADRHPDDLPFDLDAFGQWAEEIDDFPMDGCVVKRGERELALFDGQRFWLHPVIPARLNNAFIAFIGGAEDNSASRMSDPFDTICEGLSRCVVGWDLVDPVEGEDYPQPWKNPAVFRELPSEALYWILGTAVKGEVPAARPNGSTLRRGGSGTRRSSAPKTRSTSTARPRR